MDQHISDLVGFDISLQLGGRLAASDRPYRIKDAIDAVIEATGVLKGKQRRVFDSTILADAVATQDMVT